MTHSNEKRIKWPEARSGQPGLKAGLYIVATPIGNLRDITLRALDTLATADVIICEDTRVSGKLLKAYDIDAHMMSYNDHSDEKKRVSILEKIESGQSVALISDAGCPLISDPGYKLVRHALERGMAVTSIPGASAVITGLQLSGLPTDSFSFIGFLPGKQKARQDYLRDWAGVRSTLVAYETGPRLLDALDDIQSILGARQVSVARELTKMYEETRSDYVSDLIVHYKQKGAPKGEIVLIIEGAKEKVWSAVDIEGALSEALKNMKTKQAAGYIADLSGRPRKELYDLALKLSGKG